MEDLKSLLSDENQAEMSELVITQKRYDLSTDKMLEAGYKPVQCLLYWTVAEGHKVGAASLIVKAAIKRRDNKAKGIVPKWAQSQVAKSLEEVAEAFSGLE